MAGLKKFHLVESNCAVHQLRKDMYDYLKGHYKSFFASSSDSSMLKVVNTDGASMPHFRLSHKMLEMDERQGINNMICSVLNNLWNFV